MTRTRSSSLLLVVSVITVAAAPVASQTEAVAFTLRLQQGETLHYSWKGSLRSSEQGPGVNRNSETTFEALKVHRVLDVSPDGIMRIERVLEDYWIVTNGRRTEPIDQPEVFTVGPNGRVRERLVNAEGVDDDYPIPFPEGLVKVGDTWTREIKFAEGDLRGGGTTIYTLVGIEVAGNDRLARIRFAHDGTISSVPGARRGSGAIRVRAEVVLSLDRGIEVRSNEDHITDFETDLTVLGIVVGRSRYADRKVFHTEALAAGSVSVPAVAADLLITPGRSLGPFGLDARTSDVTRRAGRPQPRESDLGFKAKSVRWPNGLFGYLDADDSERLLGLETSDRRFRTEIGVHFGSSEGAVLFAYGLTPVQVSMRIPRRGLVRVLVYDDRGVAFILTADKPSPTSGRAPLAAVDGITIFAPGTGGKIFPTP